MMNDDDESCRILIVSSNVKEALKFIESVKALTSSSSVSTPKSVSVPLSVPWTITNRYYVADVHFSVWSMDKVFVELFERQPPAVVFVWSEGQEYVKDVEELARLMKLGEYEPEVALGVRIGEENGGENGDIDGVLMSFGFEYVDGTGTVEDDVPGLPRVVDALSTIIWPSMRMKKVGRRTLDLNDDSEDEMVQELLGEIKPWITVSAESDMTMSPTEEVSLGFEDDFSGFVSAPELLDAEYRTLGSVSDFGEEEMRELDEVIGVLEEYKAEVGSIENEGERQRAAARVALGLVYGV